MATLRTPRSRRLRPTAEDVASYATTIDARSQKAWRAVRVFTQMLPQLTSFARMATGNNRVAVRLGNRDDRAATDGTVIYLQPPIDLGTERTHARHLCDKRGPNKRQLCKACDAREVVLFYLFHEIAHIAFDSMATPLRGNVDKIQAMLEEWHPEGCPHRKFLLNQLELAGDYLKLCAVHNGFLPVLFNCLEDARVNARMFQARPGLRVMFDAGTRRVFDQGVANNDGTVWRWAEQPLNPQVMIGLFLLSSGTDIEPDYFAPEVTETLQDPELAKLCRRVTMARSPHQIMDVTLGLFGKLNELGYLLVPKCTVQPPTPPRPAGQDDEEQDANQPGGDPSEPDEGSTQSKSPQGDADEEGKGQPEDNAGGDGDPGSEESGEPQDQHNAGEGSSAGEAEDEDLDDGSAAEQDGGDEGSAGSRSGGPNDSDPDDEAEDSEEGSESTDEALRGSDDDHQGPEPEDQSGSSAHGTSSSGDGDDDDGDDPSDVDDSPASSPTSGNKDDREDPESRDDDDSEEDRAGDEGSSSTSTEEADGDEDDEDSDGSSDSTDSEGDEGSDDGESDGPDPDSPTQAQRGDESIWDDPESGQRGADPGPHYGDPSEVEDLVNIFGGHREADDDDVDDSKVNHEHFGDEDHEHEHDDGQRQLDRQAVQTAARQAAVFDMQSRSLEGLDVWTFPQPTLRWVENAALYPNYKEFESSESVMGRAVMRARLVFENNRRAAEERHLRSGRVDARVLGKRAPLGDERLFSRIRRPGKLDYFFAIGVDCSGSTAYGPRNARIKRAVMAQAQLFTRLGIKFAIYGMTGGDPGQASYTWGERDAVWMLEIKSPDQPWDKVAKTRLACMPPLYENYDGHNFEFLRKMLDARAETKRGIIYYTDGEMPAANGVEELLILQTELLNLKKKGYIGLGVGINTDSPRQYGLDTVQVDSDEDIQLVINQLGRKLTER